MSDNGARKTFTICAPHCGNFPCSFAVEANGEGIASFRANPAMRIKPCIKGFQIPDRYNHSDRLLYPLKRVGEKGSGPGGANRFERTSWDEALDLVARGLEAAKAKGGNESVMMYHYASQHTMPGGRDGNPATIMRLLNMWGGAIQPYLRGSLCWKAFLGGSADVFGHWQIRNRPNVDCDWIVIWGNNPVETGYRGLMQSLQEAKRGGTRFIAVDPMRTRSVNRFADRHVPIRPSTDTALALAVLRLMLAEGAADEDFLRKRTNAPFLVNEEDGAFLTAPDGTPLAWDEAAGEARPFGACERPALHGSFQAGGKACRTAFDHLRAAAEPWTPARAAKECGVSEEDVRAIAGAVRKGKVVVYYGAYQRTVHGEQAVRALHILNLVTGGFGGVLRHGGASDSFQLPRATDAGLADVVASRWGVPNLVQRTVPVGQIAEAILNPGAHGGPIHAALVMWGNPVGQAGDAHKTERALRALDFCAVSDIFMTPTAKCADVVLPASTWLERCAITEGLETGATFFHLIPEIAPRHVVMFSSGAMPQRGESLDDFEIVCRLAEKMGYGDHFPWKSSREWVEELVAAARQDERFPWFRDLTMEKLEAEGMVILDIPEPENSWDLQTPQGRARLYFEGKKTPVPTYIPPDEVAQKGGRKPLQLITPKTYFRASSTFNNAEKLLRGDWNVATLNPADAGARGISAGDRIRIYNGFGETAYRAKVSEDIRPGVVHIPAGGLPEQGAANHLTGDALSEYENAAQNSYSVEVEKVG
ncbi:MAG: molybdopterin-dependent oxidoreductase [Nitrospinota bacterium]